MNKSLLRLRVQKTYKKKRSKTGGVTARNRQIKSNGGNDLAGVGGYNGYILGCKAVTGQCVTVVTAHSIGAGYAVTFVNTMV